MQNSFCLPQEGYSLTFNTWGSVPIFGVQKFTLNQYLGSVNDNMDTNSIFGVHKSEERKNRGICLALTSRGMQYEPQVANHEINVLVLLRNLERSRSSN